MTMTNQETIEAVRGCPGFVEAIGSTSMYYPSVRVHAHACESAKEWIGERFDIVSCFEDGAGFVRIEFYR